MAFLQGDKQVVERIRRMIEAAGPDSKSLRIAFHKIGMAISGQATINATRQGIVDTGSLRSHIGYEFYNEGSTINGIRVGVFGVKYAALHEYGGPFTDRMRRAMFASLRRRGKLTRTTDRKTKGVIIGSFFRARPYLIPAFQQNKPYITQILREALLDLAGQ